MRTVFRVLGAVYLGYLALVVLLLTPALNFLPSWYADKYLQRELRSDIILFNPFTLALSLRNVALLEADGRRFADLVKAEIDLSTESLWSDGWVLDKLLLEGFYVHAKQLSAEEFNFSDLLPPEDPDAPPETEEPVAIPGITIHQVSLQADRIEFTDRTRDPLFNTRFDELEIEVSDLSTIIEEGRPYRLDFKGGGGGHLHWEGLVSIPGAYSEGTLSLADVSLHEAWRIAEPWLNFEIPSGTVGVEGGYRVDWKDALDYRISDGEFAIAELKIEPRKALGIEDSYIRLEDLTISGVDVDGSRQHVGVADFTVDGLDIAGWMEEERISLAEMFEPRGDDGPEIEAPDLSEIDTEDTGGWTAELTRTRLLNSSIKWRSPFTDPPLLEVTPLEASLGRITWPLSGDTEMLLDLGISGEVKAGIDGSLAFASGDGTIAYELEGLPLRWFNPNLPAALKARITDGHVATNGKVVLKGFSPQLITNEGAISDFAVRVQEAEQVLTNWQSVRWEALEVDTDQRNVSLQKLSLNSYEGRLHIREDGSINTSKVWQEEVGEQAQQVADELNEGKPWSFSIPQIVVTESAIDFMDESLPIKFRTVIGNLNGEVLALGSDPGSEARVDMRGSVDGYAPVLLKGTASPMSEPPALDLALGFTGVDLALLTPYSANYAGYKIESGVMNLDLQYALKNSMLDGNNSLMIDHLKLGERVESEQAVDLPLELALALLTDSNGVIEMQVPVSGDVDDPSFDVGSVVAKAFLNIITKAVTAPFKLLGSLVGSDEDLQRIQFAIGSPELDDSSRSKLDQLSGALAQRPTLTLVITGQLNLEADRKSLQWMELRQQLIKDGLPEADIDNKTAAWENAMGKRYRELGLPESDNLSMAEKSDALTAATELPANALDELAEARAVAVKTYLVNDAGMASDRAVIEQSQNTDSENLFSGAELNLKH